MTTKTKPTNPNGCYDREPYQAEMLVQDGWVETWSGASRAPRMVSVPFRMSPECNYQKDPKGYGSQDPRCEGCKWKESE